MEDKTAAAGAVRQHQTLTRAISREEMRGGEVLLKGRKEGRPMGPSYRQTGILADQRAQFVRARPKFSCAQLLQNA